MISRSEHKQMMQLGKTMTKFNFGPKYCQEIVLNLPFCMKVSVSRISNKMNLDLPFKIGCVFIMFIYNNSYSTLEYLNVTKHEIQHTWFLISWNNALG